MTTAKEIILSLESRFKPEKVEADLDIVFHFQLSGDAGGDFTVTIKDKTCRVEEGLVGEAKCTVKAKDNVYAEVELGKTNAQMAFMMGKIKVDNLNAMLKFVDCFERLH
jgi:putative sterol carrier protein